MFEMCGGNELKIEEQLLNEYDYRGDKSLAFKIVLNELILDYQRDHANCLLAIGNVFLKKGYLRQKDIIEIITTLSAVRTNFNNEDELYLYEQLEKDLVNLCVAYLKIK